METLTGVPVVLCSCYRQVGVGCVERVALMAQLWGAQDCLLQAALQDRQAARQQCAAAEAASEAAVREQQRLQQLEEDEKVALRAIRDRHAAKAAAAKEEFDALKLQHDKVSTTSSCLELDEGLLRGFSKYRLFRSHACVKRVVHGHPCCLSLLVGVLPCSCRSC